MCQVLELLLRCPTPICSATTTLIELLMDDLWEAIANLSLLEPRYSGAKSNMLHKLPHGASVAPAAAAAEDDDFRALDADISKAVMAAVVTTQKVVSCWQAGISQALLLLPGQAATAAAIVPAKKGSASAARRKSKISQYSSSSTGLDGGSSGG